MTKLKIENPVIIVLSIFFIIISCGPPRYIKKNFTLCYDGINIEVDSVLNIDGIFKLGNVIELPDNKTLYTYKNRERMEVPKIDTFYTELRFYKDGIHSNQGDYGRYVIIGDTIITQFINHPTLMSQWGGWEVQYKIIDKNTISFIQIKPLHRQSKQNNTIFKHSFITGNYIQKEKPDSNCWLLDKKWFLCR